MDQGPGARKADAASSSAGPRVQRDLFLLQTETRMGTGRWYFTFPAEAGVLLGLHTLLSPQKTVQL